LVTAVVVANTVVLVAREVLELLSSGIPLRSQLDFPLQQNLDLQQKLTLRGLRQLQQEPLPVIKLNILHRESITGV
jgi:phage terminase Nu1 subunit (DNA packaging protein)